MPTTISFTCPHCGETTDVSEQFIGQSGPCRGCGRTVQINGSYPARPPGKPVPGKPARQPRTSVFGILAVIAVVGFLGLALLTALLIPAVQQARVAAERASCSNNLKQIMLALHNYHDTHRSFPPAYTVDEEGNPLHSWRTLILPFVNQAPIYEQIRFDEPWDSPHNRQFHDVMVPLYNCPEHPNRLSYFAVTGPGTIFEGSEAAAVRDIFDGTSNTIAVIESQGRLQSWMEPVDIRYEDLARAFPTVHGRGSNAGFADGAVRLLAADIDPQILKSLTTRAGGEQIPAEAMKR